MVELITGLSTDKFEFSHSVAAHVGTWEASSYLQISHIISEKPPPGMAGFLTDEIAHRHTRQLQPLALPNVEDEVHTVRRPLPIMSSSVFHDLPDRLPHRVQGASGCD